MILIFFLKLICANNNNFLSLYMIYIMIISYSSGNMQLRGACTHIFPYSSWQLGIQSVIPHTTRRIAYVLCTYDMYIIYIYILYTVLLYVRISYIIPVLYVYHVSYHNNDSPNLCNVHVVWYFYDQQCSVKSCLVNNVDTKFVRVCNVNDHHSRGTWLREIAKCSSYNVR